MIRPAPNNRDWDICDDAGVLKERSFGTLAQAQARANQLGIAPELASGVDLGAPVYIPGAGDHINPRAALTARTVGASRRVFRPEDRSDGFFERTFPAPVSDVDAARKLAEFAAYLENGEPDEEDCEWDI